ncbi:MarR family winged helix-turn-helix transcriptional regulator [Robertmurraya andreesenii]|uniref:DNA-binding MarR family transcriptional regulator n=1 Tax=Anoxybacillus andreesenii TaxID=1325932 RepID=A0ABT9V5T9_9BACL|nr:MarR family transcriptional regulator [Robertmurraya andreesenii]MDQ0156311.1 DNA-binding MarR family transcriptional regulator [Robertmurraya andreesenii]
MDYQELAKELFHIMRKSRRPPMDEPMKYSRGEMGMLHYLHFTKDGVTSGELSESFSISTGRVASALKSLEKKGLIVRRTDSSDKRKVLVFITDSGKEVVVEAHHHAIAMTEKMLRRLTEEDAKEFVRLIKIIFTNK